MSKKKLRKKIKRLEKVNHDLVNDLQVLVFSKSATDIARVKKVWEFRYSVERMFWFGDTSKNITITDMARIVDIPMPKNKEDES